MTQSESLDMITKVQLALQAMEVACKRIDELKAENKALKEALAQPEQEPVAWWIPKAEQFCLPSSDGTRPFAKAWEPLYTTPPQRKPLTDEQIDGIASKFYPRSYGLDEFARAIEAAHGIKE